MGLMRPGSAPPDGRPTFVLVDGDSFTRQLWQASPGECVQLIERRLRSLAATWTSPRLIIAWDGPEADEFRRALWPTYKADRPDPGDHYRHLRANVPKLAARLGWKSYTCGHAEADDIIGSLCWAAMRGGNRVRVVSADKDLFQLLVDESVQQVRSFTTVGGDLSEVNYMTGELLQSKYKVTAQQWPLYRALVGDKSDAVSGVNSIGDKTAVDMFQEIPELSPENIAQAVAEARFSVLNRRQRDALREAVESGLLETLVTVSTLRRLPKEELVRLA